MYLGGICERQIFDQLPQLLLLLLILLYLLTEADDLGELFQARVVTFPGHPLIAFFDTDSLFGGKFHAQVGRRCYGFEIVQSLPSEDSVVS